MYNDCVLVICFSFNLDEWSVFILNVFVDLSKKNRHVQMPICHKRNYPSTHLDSNNIEKVGFLSQGRSLTKFIESKFLASNST